MSGLTAQIQYGFSNNVESSSEGSVVAGSLAYVNGPLSIRYAMQDRKQGNSAGALAAGSAPNTGNAKDSSVFGVRYQMGALNIAAAMLENNAATANNGAKAKFDGLSLGVGYTTGAWTLGATRVTAEESSLLNLQARYALSKRTNLIAQAGFADNNANGKVKFSPIATNTGNSPATIIDTYAATAGKKQSGFGLAVTHSF
jgi:hypothetical protein